ncbi:hypothetical protein MTO96_026667 [Rhipicephalus appendiculatus]
MSAQERGRTERDDRRELAGRASVPSETNRSLRSGLPVSRAVLFKQDRERARHVCAPRVAAALRAPKERRERALCPTASASSPRCGICRREPSPESVRARSRFAPAAVLDFPSETTTTHAHHACALSTLSLARGHRAPRKFLPPCTGRPAEPPSPSPSLGRVKVRLRFRACCGAGPFQPKATPPCVRSGTSTFESGTRTSYYYLHPSETI